MPLIVLVALARVEAKQQHQPLGKNVVQRHQTVQFMMITLVNVLDAQMALNWLLNFIAGRPDVAQR